MKAILVLGGVGSGKSSVMDYISSKSKILVLKADEIAKELMKPGGECYKILKTSFAGTDVFEVSGEINKEKMASLIFGDEKKRKLLNSIVHPAVESFIASKITEEKEANKLRALFVESAIPLKGKVKGEFDEVIYVSVDSEIRAERLSKDRGYSPEKIKAIMATQESDEAYKSLSTYIIENGGDLKNTKIQVDKMFLKFGI